MSEAATAKPPIASLGNNKTIEFVAPVEQKQDNNEGALSADEQANISNGLNKDGTAKDAGGLTDAKKAENIAAGLNEDGSTKNVELTADQKAANVTAGLNEDGTPKTKSVTDLTDAEIKELYEKKFPATAELTPEQKKAKEDALDKTRLDWFVAHGGTVDAYAQMKFVANADRKELSEKDFEKEMSDEGFTEAEKVKMREKRYFQLKDEDIEEMEDEEEKGFLKKAKEYGTKKLTNKAAHKQELAVGFFKNIDKALAAEQTDKDDEVELAQKVDSYVQTLPDKITLQMGKTKDNVDIAPLDLPVPKEVIAEVRELLRDPKQRNNFLYTEDGEPNIANLSQLFMENKVLKTGLNTAYSKGVSDNTAKFEETFPFRDANGLGLGKLQGNSQNGKAKNKIASVGKAVMT